MWSSDPSVLAHAGAWSEGDYLALRADPRRGSGRVELVEGALVVGPGPNAVLAEAVAAVRRALSAAVPDGLHVVGPVPLRLGPDCLLTPDLVVTRVAEPGPALESDDALIVVDVVGSGHGIVARSFTPQLYARSRIPYAVLVDADAPFGIATMLIGGRYHEYARAGAGERLAIEEPFPLTLDLPSFAAS